MYRHNRMLPLLLALALALLVAGCGASGGTEPSAPSAESQPASSTADITLQVTGLAPSQTIMTVAGNTASAELLTYQIGYNCSYLDYMLQAYGQTGLDLSGALPNGENAAEYVKAESIEMVKQQLVLENLAAQYGVTLSDEMEQQIADQFKANIEQLGEEAFTEELRKLGISQAGYERIIRTSYLYQALVEAFATPGSAIAPSDEELTAYAVEQGYITADHILLPTLDAESGEPLDDKTVEKNRALAVELLGRLRASGDPIALFDELADTYSSDPGRKSNPKGYTFAEGTMVDEFDAAARALGENEISDIVETTYGYHIILRRPLDTAAAADAAREGYFDMFFLDEVEKADAELSPELERFDIAAIYDAMTAAQGTDAEPVDPVWEIPEAAN